VAEKNYGGTTSNKVPFFRELGARVVIAAIARAAAKHNKIIQILNTYMRFRSTHQFNREHYLCITVQLLPHPSKNPPPLPIQSLYYHSPTQSFSLNPPEAIGDVPVVKLGPIWTGLIYNNDFLGKLLSLAKKSPFIGKHNEFMNLLKMLLKESAISDLFYYKPPGIDKKGKKGKTPSKVVALLWDKGYRASKIHWESKGIRTNATYQQLLQVMSDS